MTDPNDMEDPQASEILPPMLLEDWYADRIERGGVITNKIDDALVKYGMQRSYELLLPLMQAALPYYEAGLCDTRMGPADAGKLKESAAYKEIACYEQKTS